MKRTKNKSKRVLEHIVPIENSKQIFIYGLNPDNKIIYSYSDNPNVFLYDTLKSDGIWVILGELKLPAAYFKKYLNKEAQTLP